MIYTILAIVFAFLFFFKVTFLKKEDEYSVVVDGEEFPMPDKKSAMDFYVASRAFSDQHDTMSVVLLKNGRKVK